MDDEVAARGLAAYSTPHQGHGTRLELRISVEVQGEAQVREAGTKEKSEV